MMPRPALIHCTPPALQIAGVAEMILVAHVAVEHIGHGLEAAMRMRGEAGDIVVGIFGREMIEHQERIEAGPGSTGPRLR